MPNPFKSPKPPAITDPNVVAANQQKINQGSFNYQQQGNMVDQDTPYGKLSYLTSIDPITHQPRYKSITTLSPEQQQLLEQYEASQKTAGQTGGQLLTNTSDMYSQPADLVGGANSITQHVLDSQLPAWERFDKPAREQLDTQLRNQGFEPGTKAYKEQMDRLIQQQDLNRGQWLGQFQPQAFQEAATEFMNPLMVASQMIGMGVPGSIKENLINTPTGTMQSADLVGATKNAQQMQFEQYKAKLAQQQAMMKGIFDIGGAFVGMPGVGTAFGSSGNSSGGFDASGNR